MFLDANIAQKLLHDPSPSIRAMTIQAIRYTLPDGDEAFDTGLKGSLIDILTTMLKDPELENQRLAMTTLNSAAHNKPDLIVPNLGILLPLVIKESEVKPELIREVMMGPFKHKVDDGLEVRKVGFDHFHIRNMLMHVAECLRDPLLAHGNRFHPHLYRRVLRPRHRRPPRRA